MLMSWSAAERQRSALFGQAVCTVHNRLISYVVAYADLIGVLESTLTDSHAGHECKQVRISRILFGHRP